MVDLVTSEECKTAVALITTISGAMVWNVCVIGAGINGLGTARELQRRFGRQIEVSDDCDGEDVTGHDERCSRRSLDALPHQGRQG
uniref:DAO domain-containing protein n=1 Tax=Steinernema glaseri TaxID=37863 RepID=A0A1I7Z8G5_9BILA